MRQAFSNRRPFWNSLLPIMLGILWFGPTGSVRAQTNNIGILRAMLELNFEDTVESLDRWNQILIQNTRQQAPEEAAELEAKLQPPEALPRSNVLALGHSSFGQGLISVLFEEDFTVEQVHLLFCQDRVTAIQVLFDDSETFGDTAQLLSRVHGMGPAVPFGSHQPAFQCPLPGVTYDEEGRWELGVSASPVTVWNMGTSEALFQPVVGQRVLSGQFWLTHKESASACAGRAEEP